MRQRRASLSKNLFKFVCFSKKRSTHSEGKTVFERLLPEVVSIFSSNRGVQFGLHSLGRRTGTWQASLGSNVAGALVDVSGHGAAARCLLLPLTNARGPRRHRRVGVLALEPEIHRVDPQFTS